MLWKAGVLLRHRLSGPHHPNKVISKFRVHRGKFKLLHVARRTIVGTRRASWGRVVVRGRRVRAGAVATQASAVVGRRVLYERLVGVVASYARDALVACCPASALFEPVGRKTQGLHSLESGQGDVPPGAVA